MNRYRQNGVVVGETVGAKWLTTKGENSPRVAWKKQNVLLRTDWCSNYSRRGATEHAPVSVRIAAKWIFELDWRFLMRRRRTIACR